MQILEVGFCDILIVFNHPSLLLRLFAQKEVSLSHLGVVICSSSYLAIDYSGIKEKSLFKLNKRKYDVYVCKVDTTIIQRQRIRAYCEKALRVERRRIVEDSESAFIVKAYRGAGIDLTPCLEPHEVTYYDLLKSDLVTVDELEVT